MRCMPRFRGEKMVAWAALTSFLIFFYLEDMGKKDWLRACSCSQGCQVGYSLSHHGYIWIFVGAKKEPNLLAFLKSLVTVSWGWRCPSFSCSTRPGNSDCNCISGICMRIIDFFSQKNNGGKKEEERRSAHYHILRLLPSSWVPKPDKVWWVQRDRRIKKKQIPRKKSFQKTQRSTSEEEEEKTTEKNKREGKTKGTEIFFL